MLPELLFEPLLLLASHTTHNNFMMSPLAIEFLNAIMLSVSSTGHQHSSPKQQDEYPDIISGNAAERRGSLPIPSAGPHFGYYIRALLDTDSCATCVSSDLVKTR